MSISSILKKKDLSASTFPASNTVLEATKKMAETKMHALIILDDQNNLAGIVTDHDILGELAQNEGVLRTVPVSDIMSTKLITCSCGASLKKVLYLMSHHRVRHIIVVDAGQVRGLLSIKDVLTKVHEDEALELNVLRDIAVAARN